MSNMISKYLTGVTGITLVFSSFVACGTQMYKAKMDEDVGTSSFTKAQPPETSDKTSTLYGIHAPKGWTKLPIVFKFGQDMDTEQRVQLLAAMKRWEWAVGQTLFSFDGQHAGVTGDTFKDLYSSLSDAVNGNYLDEDWAKTQKPEYVLATTIWNNGNDYSVIDKADIRFNTEFYLIGDSMVLKAEEKREVVDMQSLALHELGHLLGLGHIDEDFDSLSIMNPSLFIGEGLTTRKLSRGDIERIQQIYGCKGEACDIETLAKEQEEGKWENLALTAKEWNERGTKQSPPLKLN